MSVPLRIVLLVGCGLVAALEAPQAGRSLSAGLAGPYADSTPQRVETTARGPLREPGFALPPVPLLFALTSPPVHSPLAVGR